MRHEFTIAFADAGRRCDRYVAAALDKAPRSLVQKLFRKGEIKLNGQRARPSDLLKEDDQLVVYHRSAPAVADPVELFAAYRGPEPEVLHRGQHYLALNKPAGVSCSEDDRSGENIQSWLREHFADRSDLRPCLCHRLDRGTTGALLVALSSVAVAQFHQALESGQVEKIYQVAIWGHPPLDSFILDTPLVRLPHAPSHHPKVVPSSDGQGQSAQTHLQVLQRGEAASLLQARIVTGRTHQIRAHLYGAGWPVVGDRRYGDPELDRIHGLQLPHQMLHASLLRVTGIEDLPEIRALLPTESQRALQQLGLDPAVDG